VVSAARTGGPRRGRTAAAAAPRRGGSGAAVPPRPAGNTSSSRLASDNSTGGSTPRMRKASSAAFELALAAVDEQGRRGNVCSSCARRLKRRCHHLADACKSSTPRTVWMRVAAVARLERQAVDERHQRRHHFLAAQVAPRPRLRWSAASYAAPAPCAGPPAPSWGRWRNTSGCTSRSTSAAQRPVFCSAAISSRIRAACSNCMGGAGLQHALLQFAQQAGPSCPPVPGGGNVSGGGTPPWLTRKLHGAGALVDAVQDARPEPAPSAGPPP